MTHVPEGLFRAERVERLLGSAQGIRFGIGFLDDAIRGILPTDIVLIGAATGVGKTEIASAIAMNGARNGRTVHFFALEAEKWEIERRLKYAELARLFYSGPHRDMPGLHLNYLDWRWGDYDDSLAELERKAEQTVSMDLGNLNVIYREKDFGVKDFLDYFEHIQHETDLVILDHLHFFDFDDENELRALRKAIKVIRDAALRHAKPVILLAQLRKANLQPGELPSIHEFHGPADVTRQATAVVMLSLSESDEADESVTRMQVVKCRGRGEVRRFVAMMRYDTRSNTYTPNYYLARVKCSREAPIILRSRQEMPYWAKNAKETVL